jgi:putative transposase
MATHDADQARLRLIQQVLRLPTEQLDEAERFFARLHTGAAPPVAVAAPPSVQRDWPHAPTHRLSEHGTYIVTASTLGKAHHFRGPERLDYLERELLSLAKTFGWQLEAWAVFSNHYHFVAHSPPSANNLPVFLRELHSKTAGSVNELDGARERQVWFNYWDKLLTYEKSYMARLSYVHRNPVKHGLVAVAKKYRWCSAAWLERTATPAQVATLYRFKIDRISILDDFDPI